MSDSGLQLCGMPVYIDSNVPLLKTAPDGTKQDALFWMLDEVVLVHPNNLERFVKMLETYQKQEAN